MSANTALFPFQLKIDLGLPYLPSLIQQDDQESVLSDSEPSGFMLDVSMDFRRKPDLRCDNLTFHPFSPLDFLVQMCYDTDVLTVVLPTAGPGVRKPRGSLFAYLRLS